jgi:hypothetical protein
MKYEREVFDHMMACMKLWQIHVSSDGRFWAGPRTADGRVTENHVRSMLRQELMIAFRLSEAARKKYINSLLAFAIDKAGRLERGEA